MGEMEESAIKIFSKNQAKEIAAKICAKPSRELDILFANGSMPSFKELQGDTYGSWPGREKYTWWARVFIWFALDSVWARWDGKRFVEPWDSGKRGKGVNVFRNILRPYRHSFATYEKQAFADTRPAIALEYPFGSLMWGMIDDVRKIEPGIFLGQVWFRFPLQKKYAYMGYFLLCKI